jgi:hypothetical protein
MSSTAKPYAPNNQPEFNSGIAYLERIHLLMIAAHRSSINKDYQGQHLVLNQLFIEILPRLIMNKRTGEIKEIKDIRKACNSLVSQRKINTHSASMKLIEFFEKLNCLVHQEGLVMPNKDRVSSILQEV